MAADFGPLEVRVNAIAPGEVETDILSEGTDQIVKKIPLRRLGLPEEVANTIYFLCSNESGYISGAECTLMVVTCLIKNFILNQVLKDKLKTLFFKYVEVASPEICLKSFKNVDIKGKLY